MLGMIPWFKVGAIGIVVLFFIASIGYYNWSQGEFKVYQANQAKLEQALTQQTQEFQNYAEKTNRIIANNTELQKRLANVEEKSAIMAKSIRALDIARLAKQDPKALETRINDGTKRIKQELEGFGK